jgi:hypothetical protein
LRLEKLKEKLGRETEEIKKGRDGRKKGERREKEGRKKRERS